MTPFSQKTPSRPVSAGSSGRTTTTSGGAIAPVPEGANGPDGSESDATNAAYVHVRPRAMPLPVLIAVPHAGRVYPGDVLATMRDAGLSQLRLEDRYVDAVGVEVAKATGTGLLVAQAPRAMLDLNRSADDIDWEMIVGAPEEMRSSSRSHRRGRAMPNSRARSGLGLVPRRLPGFGEIWRERLPARELARRIDRIHRPYHEFLGKELERIRDAWGAALLIDLHSMPPLRRPSGEERAPQIVLGDRFGASCHHTLAARALSYLDRHGCAAAHNRPYSGGYVLDRHAAPARGIHGIQIELCRSTYLDATMSQTTAAVKPLANMIAGLVRELGAETAGLGAGGQAAQAAE
ncbi:N-formylglutamate amidohydrolase [Erythrobacter sp. KY5]|uniref:N-formylglutamate amidohydrolase n=1 Tax=Erythrobacter sp. KY5 TaxID=2011159 RepID=UPI000DBF234C|nr:N-formylglutamate amidohydrolase [Erythrobacter sp. KY5]AWW75068.1 N-formylglutamate amidohydrolase [Erythrobacter sp. KY5]